MPPIGFQVIHHFLRILLAIWVVASIVMLWFMRRFGWRAMLRWQRTYVWVLGLFAALDVLFYLAAVLLRGPLSAYAAAPMVRNSFLVLAAAWYYGIILTMPLMAWGVAVGITTGLELLNRPRPDHSA